MDDGILTEEGRNEILTVQKSRKRKYVMRKFEFVGWGSKPLIEFLEGIGKDTKKKYSRLEVVSFITKYINVKGLTAPGNKKKAICDEKLFAIFGKQMITRKKVHELLEEHFSENCASSDDESEYSSDEKDDRKNSSKFPMPQKNAAKNGFASVVPENIKLVYLKKSLVRELLEVPESFEEKITGSFVRMKSDPYDIYKKNEFQLQLVTGVENFSSAVSSDNEIRLKVANFFKAVPLSMLSDDNFSKEEVEDVQQKIENGSLKKFSLHEFESKARMLHVDITKHWISRELSLLDKRIDHANEKGWRRDFSTLFEHLDRRKKLQTPSEVEKLLRDVPRVMAEETAVDDSASPRGGSDDDDDRRPPSGGDRQQVHHHPIVPSAEGRSAAERADAMQVETPSENKTAEAAVGSAEERFAMGTEISEEKLDGARPETIELSSDEEEGEKGGGESAVDVNAAVWCYVDPRGKTRGPFSLRALKRWKDANYFDPGFKIWEGDRRSGDGVLLTDALRRSFG